jgi:hypothetical protein
LGRGFEPRPPYPSDLGKCQLPPTRTSALGMSLGHELRLVCGHGRAYRGPATWKHRAPRQGIPGACVRRDRPGHAGAAVLRETIPASPNARREAERALTRLQHQVERKVAPDVGHARPAPRSLPRGRDRPPGAAYPAGVHGPGREAHPADARLDADRQDRCLRPGGAVRRPSAMPRPLTATAASTSITAPLLASGSRLPASGRSTSSSGARCGCVRLRTPAADRGGGSKIGESGIGA